MTGRRHERTFWSDVTEAFCILIWVVCVCITIVKTYRMVHLRLYINFTS